MPFAFALDRAARSVGLGLATFGLLAALLGRAGAQEAPAAPVTVAKPVVKPIVEDDEFIGRFEAVDQVDIRARVAGYVAEITFSDGALVKAGDLLMTIDKAPYKAALDQAQATWEAAKARLDFARTDLERATTLQRTGDITTQLADTRQQNFATAQGDFNSAKAALDRAQLDIGYTEIRAPIAGRMSRRQVSIGDLVTADQTVLTNIVSVDPINFYFDVDERTYLAYQQLSAGGLNTPVGDSRNQVKVAVGAEPRPIHPGYLDFTENRLDAESGTMRARAVLPNADGRLIPGLFGRIALLGSEPYDGVLIPDEAVAADQDRRIVYVLKPDNTAEMRPVRLGPKIDGYRVIRAGLKGDDTIVVNGLMRVRPGVKLAPQTTELQPVAETLAEDAAR
ncbi:MexE family multidrug efflux RND transporter periplasmic adaptor subunit [Aureimonas endophytica]|uniref:MexE family multidrug efflux RND transporter periplasmic adaptor subunit n=1 Tax=Aureimonas endophytica TaxID=2027858 RepID=A0A916ZT60_9HYPH|nr:efflux RND transporter periplasmic adaptor subunit [Aureimonas endophytica]GGE11481.1 MexE family multidrug efflux RND transporter periplasmic adaptor subunit [Aureimonas endophytica]